MDCRMIDFNACDSDFITLFEHVFIEKPHKIFYANMIESFLVTLKKQFLPLVHT